MAEPIRTDADPALLQSVAGDAIALARRLGASAVEASASDSTGLNVAVRLGEVETLEFQRDRGLSVTVYLGQRKGSASTADLAPGSLRATVDAALAIARHTSEDPNAGLPDAALLARDAAALDGTLDLWHPWPIAAEEAIALAKRCEDAARADPRIHNSEGASLNSHSAVRVLGNSLGFVGTRRSTRHGLACSVLAKDDAGMQRDYWYDSARAPADLAAPEAIGAEAAARTVRRLGARRLATRTAPVLFAPDMARGLVAHALGALSGGSQYRKASFLLDAEGETVFPAWFSLFERPHLPRALGSAAYDGEGVATRDRTLVDRGVIGGYLLDSYAARKLGRAATGNAGGAHNVLCTDTGQDAARLLAEMGEGLLVTELLGQGVNGVTGDYSRGAAGFWVEGGQVAHPVDEVTIAGNLRQMYRDLAAVGTDVDPRGNIRIGSVLVGAMKIAGE
jgi:PmbA protein